MSDKVQPPTAKCPQCGSIMEREEDCIGFMYQCSQLDCLAFYEAEESEETEND